ncbi:MAG: hypothetical protein PHR16_06510 [Methylovulum sp.]|nr:hypothetical protein [Methylovulum sp.]
MSIKNKRLLIYLLSLCMATASFNVSAVCTRADLTGTWRIYSVFSDSVMRCMLIMPSSGTSISSKSSCYILDFKSSKPLTGKLTIDSACHITGNVIIDAKQRSIDAWVSKGKDSISGMGWDPAQAFSGDVFAGAKQ